MDDWFEQDRQDRASADADGGTRLLLYWVALLAVLALFIVAAGR